MKIYQQLKGIAAERGCEGKSWFARGGILAKKRKNIQLKKSTFYKLCAHIVLFLVCLATGKSLKSFMIMRAQYSNKIPS